MSIALIVVKKDAGGHTWSNTHAVQIGAGTSGIPSDADLTTLGMATPATASNTATGMANFVQRLLAFERLLHQPDVHFNTIYVQDGKNNKEAGAPTVYATMSLDFVGNTGGATVASGVTLAPGSIAWLINRNIIGFSHKPGRLFIRGCLRDQDIKPAGNRMLDWTDTTTQNTFATALATALSTSTLNLHVGSGAQVATAMYGVPHFLSAARDGAAGLTIGDLGAVLPVSGFTSMRPANRQTQRGRKRKVAVGA